MSKLYISGHNGMVGSSVLRSINRNLSIPKNFGRLEIVVRSRQELDLTRQADVEAFFAEEIPEIVICASAKVGGILSNTLNQGLFIRENLLIQTNIIEAARKFGCKKFCFLGSSCIYPRLSPQPIREEYLLTSDLESSNRGYAVAKIAGVEMIRAYRQQYDLAGYYSLMPTNLYGIGDKFDPNNSHALPALIGKFHEAKINGSDKVVVWGKEGKIRREWMFSEDIGDIILQTLFIDHMPDITNIGVGEDLSIHELALLIQKVVGFEGRIEYDATKPEGTPRKLLDISRMKSLGLKAETDLETGIRETYDWFIRNKSN